MTGVHIKSDRLSENMKSATLVIPTLNAEKHLEILLPALDRQNGIQPSQVLVIDSDSDDDTASRFAAWGAKVITIRRSEFDHGGTRQIAVEASQDSDFLIYMTQDATPVGDESLVKLLAAFRDETVAVAYGRQLPRQSANAIEAHARNFNYPGTNEKRYMRDSGIYGAKTYFSSNSFAAYRRVALQSVGGFPKNTFFAEDQIVAAKCLMKNYAIAYVSEAQVVHSHGYSIREEFSRYFDIGVFHSRNLWLLNSFGQAESAGAKFVKSEIEFLISQNPFKLPEAIIRTGAKYIGYKLGRNEKKLSSKVKEHLSMQPYYWRKAENGAGK